MCCLRDYLKRGRRNPGNDGDRAEARSPRNTHDAEECGLSSLPHKVDRPYLYGGSSSGCFIVASASHGSPGPSRISQAPHEQL